MLTLANQRAILANMENQSSTVSERVAANVRQLRQERGDDLADVSERLTRLGRPIGVSALSKLETGKRRVDADDLMALAIVLDVTPNRLLLMDGASTDDSVELVPDFGALDARSAWQWASGEHLVAHGFSDYADDAGLDDTSKRMARYYRENRPHDQPDMTILSDMVPHVVELRQLADMLDKLEQDGVTRKAALRFVELFRDGSATDGVDNED